MGDGGGGGGSIEGEGWITNLAKPTPPAQSVSDFVVVVCWLDTL